MASARSDVSPTLRRRQRIHRMRLFMRYHLLGKRGPQTAAFVLSAGRDGSNLLVDYLNGLPDVHFLGEVLNPALEYGIGWDVSASQAIRHVRRSLGDVEARIGGCKIHFAQLEQRDLSADDLHEAFAEAKFVVLYRRSMAEQFVSRARAAASGQWLVRDPSQRKQVTVTIDPDELVDYCRTMRQRYESLLALPWVKDAAVLLAYEDLAAEPQRLFDERIFPFLGIDPQPIETSMVKQSTKTLAETVENYDAVRETIESDACRHRYD